MVWVLGILSIDGGVYHKRKIRFIDDQSLRPTGSRVRTILFDWLRMEVKGKDCLDLFSGSGILSFQALSWGAKSSLCIDQNIKVCSMIQEQADILGAKINTQKLSLPNKITGEYDICFIDPPFSQQEVLKQVLFSIQKQQILKPDAIVYVEWGTMLELKDWNILKYKKVGQVHMHLLEQK
jgi:16S rRNA (guanine966-N2)-methyltransferase